jgi:hypothetical protein
MFDHEALQETLPVVGVDLCFSGLDANSIYVTHARIKDYVRYTDLGNADWFWAGYGHTLHVVALHEPVDLPAALIQGLQEMVYDAGADIAHVIGVIRNTPTKCEGMEFYFEGCGITHDANRLHPILPPDD